MKVEMLADGLGWPEGPAPLPDGRILFVETYRSQVSVCALVTCP
jgi:gluconolactonase